MTPKKIALVLAPLVAFALGWSVHALLAPPAADEAEVASGEPRAGGGPPAEGKAGEKPKAGARAKGEKAGAGEGARGQAAKGEEPGGATPQLETAKFSIKLWAEPKVPAPEGTRVRFVPKGGEQALSQVRRWARAKGDETLVALFSEEGFALEGGALLVEETPAMGLTLEFWSEIGAFERGTRDLGKLEAKKMSGVQVDLREYAAGASGAATARAGDAGAKERRRAPAELVPFHGLVLTEAEEPAPVEGAKVQDRGRTLATTDAEGRFELPYDAALAPTVRVVGDGLGPAIVQVGPGHATPEEAKQVKLRPSAAMEVRILTSDDRPVPNVRIELATDMRHVVGAESGFGEDAPPPAQLGEITWEAVTNNFGAAFLEGLPADAPLAIRASRAGDDALPGLPKEVTLAPGEAWKDTWVLPTRPDLRGRVVDLAGEPIAGAPIWLVRSRAGELTGARYLGRDDRPAATARSDEHGAFVFEDVAAGVWLVGVGLPESGSAMPLQLELDHLARPVEVPEPGGPELGELLLRVGRGLSMHGLVLGPEGRAAAGVLVTALESSGRGVAEARTDAKGEFELGPLAPGSFRLILAGREGSGIQTYGPIAAGERGLVLKLARATPLTGRVVSASGEARAASVAVFQGDVLRAQVRTQEPAKPGVFEAPGLEPGTYDFVATTEDGHVGVVRDVAVGPGQPAGAVRVALAQGGLVTLRHEDARASAPFAFVQDGRPIALGILQRGVPRALFAPAGALVVRLEVEEGHPAIERSIEVPAGGAVELTLGAGDASD